MTPIYITSWHRGDMLAKVVQAIHERTALDSYEITVWDNHSNPETMAILHEMFMRSHIENLILWGDNAKCCYPKLQFQAMSEGHEFYVVTDNDVLPPQIEPDWLSSMLDIMKSHPKLGLLSLRLPPESLQMPTGYDEEVVFCRAVGNTFKLVRREAWPSVALNGQFGDDSTLSQGMLDNGWLVGFCRHLYCLHMGQTTNWGYKTEEVALDPRKVGYGKPYEYSYNPLTLEPWSGITEQAEP